MPISPLSHVIQHLRLDARPDGSAITDAELLARFLSHRDSDALAELVRRHAAMVWGVCGRLLHNQHDAEDAFQATFLVLVRKAPAVPRQAVANWLYGVAQQTAVRLRATAMKRGRREMQVMNMPEAEDRGHERDDVRTVLDLELGRLPEHYRGVIVLCDLGGMTRKEAARQLGIPEGSAASRLARGRALLAKRLTQRGVVLSGGSVVAALSAGSALASAPPALVASTIQAASLLATGKAAGVISAKVAALTEGTVKAMCATKIKKALAVVLVIATCAGAAGLIYEARAAGQPTEEQPIVGKNQKPEEKPARSDKERMLGNWFIMNEDSGRRGEMWAITEDSILMHAKSSGPITQRYYHRLDAGKIPKQIDINVISVHGPPVGVFKGIYVLEGNELRLSLGQLDKDRPTEFPKKPKQGEVLILQRAQSGAMPPKATRQPAAGVPPPLNPRVLLVCTAVKAGDNLEPSRLITHRGKQYRRLREGEPLSAGEVVMLLDGAEAYPSVVLRDGRVLFIGTAVMAGETVDPSQLFTHHGKQYRRLKEAESIPASQVELLLDDAEAYAKVEASRLALESSKEILKRATVVREKSEQLQKKRELLRKNLSEIENIQGQIDLARAEATEASQKADVSKAEQEYIAARINWAYFRVHWNFNGVPGATKFDGDKRPGEILAEATGNELVVHAVLESVDVKGATIAVKWVAGGDGNADFLMLVARGEAVDPRTGFQMSREKLIEYFDRKPKLANVPVRADAKIVNGKVAVPLKDLRVGSIVALQLAADRMAGFDVVGISALDTNEVIKRTLGAPRTP